MNYHDDYSAVSASMLRVLMASPLTFYRRFIAKDLPQEESDAMRFGTMFHTSVLEPDTFGDHYTVMPDFHLDAGNVTAKGERSDSKATAYYKAKVKEYATENSGKQFVSKDEIDLVSRMSKMCWNHKDLHQLLTSDAVIEEPIYWEKDIRKKCRPDLVSRNYRVVLDLKTCDEANPAAFASKIAKLGYFIQAAWYREALRHSVGYDFRFVFAAVSKKEPHEVGLYEIDSEDMEWAENKCQELVGELVRRTDEDDWFSCWQNGINTLKLPNWVKSEWFSME